MVKEGEEGKKGDKSLFIFATSFFRSMYALARFQFFVAGFFLANLMRRRNVVLVLCFAIRQ